MESLEGTWDERTGVAYRKVMNVIEKGCKMFNLVSGGGKGNSGGCCCSYTSSCN